MRADALATPSFSDGVLKAAAIVLPLALVLGIGPQALIWGPIILGTPHLIEGAKALHRSLRPAPTALAISGAAITLLFGIRTAELAGLDATWAARAELVVGTGWIALALGRRSAAWLVVPLAFALATPLQARTLLVLAHGLVALWWLHRLRPERSIWWAMPLGIVVIALVPGPMTDRVLAAQLFLQLVHYASWLLLVPQRPKLGGPIGWLGSLAVIALAFALHDAAKVRTLYLSLATFHVWLELAALGFTARRR